MRGIVDSDTHVVEHEAMWENFDDGGKMYPYRPILVKLPADTSWMRRNASWLIDGEMFPKSVGRGAYNSHSPSMSIMESERTDISQGARQMTDVADRLRDMDKQGVDIFVTCFADDDLDWVQRYTGEDNLIIGSDYSHQDPAQEMQFVEEMRYREDLPSDVTEKILCENARNFYPL